MSEGGGQMSYIRRRRHRDMSLRCFISSAHCTAHRLLTWPSLHTNVCTDCISSHLAGLCEAPLAYVSPVLGRLTCFYLSWVFLFVCNILLV